LTTNNRPKDLPAGVRHLDTAECWRLLAGQNLGRFAVQGGDGVDVFPINYLVHENALYFRSAPGSKLIDLTHAPVVAFEIDGQLAHYMWSVVVHGVASRLDSDAEIEESGVMKLQPWYPDAKFNYIRITPSTVSGRKFAKAPSASL